ncbi:MAG: phage integrase SAM-like domain-containing protein, partial [Vicingaceae bacterium]
MNYSFKLKEPKSDKETLIYFTAFFKNEGKSFIYSTGEKIYPNDWDFKNKRPVNLSGRKKDADFRRAVDSQLSRYSNLFKEVTTERKLVREALTIEQLREEFNSEFKKVSNKTNDFFTIYDRFLNERKNNKTDQANSYSTIQRYECNKKLLEGFETKTGLFLRLNNINKKFYNMFVHYCVEEKEHCANTLSRNVGLFKTFMFWAIANKYTYNDEFKSFANVKRFATDEIALTLNDIENIYIYDLKENKKLIRVRDLFLF